MHMTYEEWKKTVPFGCVSSQDAYDQALHEGKVPLVWPGSWISVKDRLPEKYERVVIQMIRVVSNDRPDPMVDHVTPRNFHTAAGEDISYLVWSNAPHPVTHWCGIPEFKE